MAISPKNFTALRNQMGISQEAFGKLLGITGKYVGMIERGEKTVDATSSLGLLFAVLEAKPLRPGSQPSPGEGDSILKEDTPPYGAKPPTRMIPVVSWAHAGQASNYEELPKDWQQLVPTECRDDDAFALRLEGDSMTRDYHPGDLLIISPNTEVYSGCLAVVRFVNDSVVFREIELRSDVVRLMPLNERWPVETIARDQISWIYRVYGMWRQLVK